MTRPTMYATKAVPSKTISIGTMTDKVRLLSPRALFMLVDRPAGNHSVKTSPRHRHE
jgi:hypothetical protein